MCMIQGMDSLVGYYCNNNKIALVFKLSSVIITISNQPSLLATSKATGKIVFAW